MSVRLLLPLVLLLLLAGAALADPLVDEYTRELGDENSRVRWDSLRSARKLGAAAEPIVPLLIEHLSNKIDRLEVIITLGELGTVAKPALPKLCSMLDESLKDPSPYDDNASMRPIILTAIEKIGQNSDTTTVLRKALKHPVSTVRYRAAYVLGEGGSAAQPAIADLENLSSDHQYVGLYVYDHGKDVAESAALALKKLKDQGVLR